MLGLSVIIYLYIRKKATDNIFSLADRNRVVFNGGWPVAVDDIDHQDNFVFMRSREIVFPFGFGKRKALGIYAFLTKDDVNAIDTITRRLPALVSDNTRLSTEEKSDVLEGQKALLKLLDNKGV